MVARATLEHKSPHQLAFSHYLRTGQRLSAAEWLEQGERKFNPYHDPKNGRFTFAPGGSQQDGGKTAQQRGNAKKLRPVKGYPESGSTSWRNANDEVYEKAANKFNQDHNLKPGDPRYITPEFMKAWSMVESGGESDRKSFLTDPFQVNNKGDWADEKSKYGLTKGQNMTPEASADAALKWLDKKGSLTTLDKGGGSYSTRYVNRRYALENYNKNKKIDDNGKMHYVNYADKVINLTKQ